MKNTIYNTGTSEARPGSPLPQMLLMEVGVVLGSPSNDCDGHGVCFIAQRFQHIQKACFITDATICLTTSGTLQFRFLKDALQPGQQDKYFRNNEFLVEAYYALPEFVLNWLNRVHAAIQPGVYEVFETPDTLTVAFEI